MLLAEANAEDDEEPKKKKEKKNTNAPPSADTPQVEVPLTDVSGDIKIAGTPNPILTKTMSMTESLGVPHSNLNPSRSRKLSILEDKNIFAHPELTSKDLSKMNPSKMVKHLYYQDQPSADEIHPAIHDIGLKLIADRFTGTNQTTVAILLAVKEVIRSFT